MQLSLFDHTEPVNLVANWQTQHAKPEQPQPIVYLLPARTPSTFRSERHATLKRNPAIYTHYTSTEVLELPVSDYAIDKAIQFCLANLAKKNTTGTQIAGVYRHKRTGQPRIALVSDTSAHPSLGLVIAPDSTPFSSGHFYLDLVQKDWYQVRGFIPDPVRAATIKAQNEQKLNKGDLVEIVYRYAGAIPGAHAIVEKTWIDPNGTQWARLCFGINQGKQKLRQSVPTMQMKQAIYTCEEPPCNCAVCGREVHINPVHQYGYIYHTDCWRKRVQREKEIRDNATKPYTCAICEQEITGKIVRQNGHALHEECYYRMEAYGQRVEARYNRLLNAATKHEQESDRLHAYTSKVYDGLNGTPILIGHHSEKRHRRLLDKLWAMDGKAYQHYKTAERLRERAEATRKNRAISSDDPAAIVKLKEKLANLEAAHEHMVKVNKVIHKLAKRPKLEDAGTLYLGSPERREIWQRNEAKMAEFVKSLPALAPKLAEMAGISEAEARKLLTPDDLHRFGYISYELTNSTAEIRRLKQRIEDLQKQAKQAATAPESERTYGNIRVIENAAENRLQIVFPGKPAKDVIAALKSHGFHWSPSNMAWQRMLTADARWKVEYVLKIAGVSIPQKG